MVDLNFFKGKRVLLTGHTGFKGSWMSVVLANAGAEVIGYSSCSKTETRLFDLCGIKDQITHIKGDVRDLDHLLAVFAEHQPQIVIHMAAQPIVRDSYKDPVGTYSTNVMGTVNVCEAVRQTPSVRSFLNVTTDKVYLNREWEYGYRENERLDGFDPYSNSKSCSELVTASYRRSFFGEDKRNCAITTCRAGNVIGGGDFAKDRIIPDCVRAAMAGEQVILRNPYSIRPYQHVLDPLYVYLMLAMEQQLHPELAGSYNVGPDDSDCAETGVLADLFCGAWGEGMRWKNVCEDGPHEANFLKLDCAKLRKTFGWQPKLHLPEAVEMTVDWTKAWLAGEDMRAVTDAQIRQVLSF